MALLLETNLGGDLVIDLDIEGSPALCKNILKLAKIRYYTGSLLYNVHANRFCQGGDPTGTGKGGACIFGVLDSGVDDETASTKRFLKSTSGKRLSSTESRERGRVVAMELTQTKDTIGSQFLITLGQGRAGDGMDGYLLAGEEHESTAPLSLGVVTEDDGNILDKIERSYCDPDGRPYADVRIVRMLVLHDPFPDPPGLMDYLQSRVPDMLVEGNTRVMASPDRSKPTQESVPERIPANELEDDKEETEEQTRQRQEKEARQEDHQRAVVLELLGDLPSAEIKAPDHVLFVCKLNAVTQDEDLELIFSRFDQNCKVEIIRDQETGSSLQYAFIEFSNKQQCVEAYFKMNNALVDDRRIKVDFSQSVSKLWNKHTQRMRMPKTPEQDSAGPPVRGSNSNNKSAPQHDRHPRAPQNSREGRPPPQRGGGGPDVGRSRQPDADNHGRRDADTFDNRRPPPHHNDNNQNDARRYNGNGDRFREDQHRRDGAHSRDNDFRGHHGDRDDAKMRRDRHEHHSDHNRGHEHDHRRRRDEHADDGGEDKIRSKSREIRRGHDYDEDRRGHHSKNEHDHRRRHDHERRHHANPNDETESRGHSDERRPGRGEEGHHERSRHNSQNGRHRGDDKMKHRRSRERARDDNADRNMQREKGPAREVGDDEDGKRHRREHRPRDDDSKERLLRESEGGKERRRRKQEHHRRGDDDEEAEPRKHKRESPDEKEEKRRHRHKHKKRDKDDDEERRRRKKERKRDEDDDERKSRKREKRHRRSDEDRKRHRSRSRSVDGEDESRKHRNRDLRDD